MLKTVDALNIRVRTDLPVHVYAPWCWHGNPNGIPKFIAHCDPKEFPDALLPGLIISPKHGTVAAKNRFPPTVNFPSSYTVEDAVKELEALAARNLSSDHLFRDKWVEANINVIELGDSFWGSTIREHYPNAEYFLELVSVSVLWK